MFTARRGRLGRGLRSVLVPCALLVAVAGCGLPHPGSSGGSPGAGTGPLAFSACMRAHGIPDFPDPSGSGGNRIADVNGQVTIDGVRLRESQAQYNSARQACLATLSTGSATNAPPSAQEKSDALAYAQCMRAHGVANFPDPLFQNGGIQFSDHGQYNPNSSAFKAASTACQSELTAANRAARQG